MIISLVMSACVSVRMENSAVSRRIFMKFNIEFLRKFVEKIRVLLKCGKSKSASNEDQYTYIYIISRSVLRMIKRGNVRAPEH